MMHRKAEARPHKQLTGKGENNLRHGMEAFDTHLKISIERVLSVFLVPSFLPAPLERKGALDGRIMVVFCSENYNAKLYQEKKLHM